MGCGGGGVGWRLVSVLVRGSSLYLRCYAVQSRAMGRFVRIILYVFRFLLIAQWVSSGLLPGTDSNSAWACQVLSCASYYVLNVFQ